MPLSSHHFRDRAGYLYCRACGIVWERLNGAPDVDTTTLGPDAFTTAHRLGVAPGFDASDADDGVSRFIRLARAESNVRGAKDRRTSDARFRIGDAACMCETLRLPPDVREAVLHHVAALAMRADMRKLSTGSRTRPRAEAFTIATLAIVCERFNVAADVPLLFETVTFTRGPERITSEEYRVAYAGAYSWYAANVWRT